ncbi:MAG TPA: hypothetical protein EYP19_02765 [Desulfobacterales bacterium]|nr:hypothetical protein [Desulfobacterales bacterium]
MRAISIFSITGLLIIALAHDLPAQAHYLTLRQPDGTTFQAIERGDEWLRFFETPEGFIVRRGGDGYFQYFNINALGEFVPTGLRVGIDRPVNVPVRPYEQPEARQALIRKIEAYNAAAEANRQRYLQRQRGGPSKALSKPSAVSAQINQQEVTLSVGVLLVEFNGRPYYTGGNDRPNGYLADDFEKMLFSDDGYNGESPDQEAVFGSLRDYFEYQSHGLLHVTGQVINPSINDDIPTWLNMGSSAPYDDLYSESDDLLRDAIYRAVADSGWNCNYDIIAVIVSQDDWSWYRTGVA